MNALAPATVALADPEIEGIVLGSLIMSPEAMNALGEQLAVELFTDPAGHLIFEAIRSLHGEGHKLSPALLVSRLPVAIETEEMTRAQFVARLAAQAMPLAHLSGYIATLHDRRARRVLSEQGDVLRETATRIDADPVEAAGAAIAALDDLSAARRESASATLYRAGEKLFAAIAATDRRRSPTTGMPTLDRLLNGYAPGQLYVVGGRPGMGKSAFGCSSLRRTAEDGDGVLLFSLEMGAEEISARCLSDSLGDIGAPHFGNILRGDFAPAWSDRIGDAHAAHKALPFIVDATPALTFSQIASRARRAKARFDAQGKRLGVVAIDHLGLVSPSSRYAGNKVAETGEISRAAKAMAKELGCCVLLFAQLNRGVEGREEKLPDLADLRWSGDIEQDSDVVAFLYREHHYLTKRPDADPEKLMAARHRLDFLIRKNRNGECRDVPLWCSIAHSSIREMRS
jgi:replicative DNA helicase